MTEVAEMAKWRNACIGQMDECLNVLWFLL